MAALLVRDLDDEVKEKLKVISKANGRSLEAQVRHILTQEVSKIEYAWINLNESADLGTRIHGWLEGEQVDLDIPARSDPATREDLF